MAFCISPALLSKGLMCQPSDIYVQECADYLLFWGCTYGVSVHQLKIKKDALDLYDPDSVVEDKVRIWNARVALPFLKGMTEKNRVFVDYKDSEIRMKAVSEKGQITRKISFTELCDEDFILARKDIADKKVKRMKMPNIDYSVVPHSKVDTIEFMRMLRYAFAIMDKKQKIGIKIAREKDNIKFVDSRDTYIMEDLVNSIESFGEDSFVTISKHHLAPLFSITAIKNSQCDCYIQNDLPFKLTLETDKLDYTYICAPMVDNEYSMR